MSNAKQPHGYPAWVDSVPGIDGTVTKILVKNEAEHEKMNPEDYAEKKAYVPPSELAIHAAIKDATAAETARCAQVAWDWPRAGAIGRDIAKHLRGETEFPKYEQPAKKSFSKQDAELIATE